MHARNVEYITCQHCSLKTMILCTSSWTVSSAIYCKPVCIRNSDILRTRWYSAPLEQQKRLLYYKKPHCILHWWVLLIMLHDWHICFFNTWNECYDWLRRWWLTATTYLYSMSDHTFVTPDYKKRKQDPLSHILLVSKDTWLVIAQLKQIPWLSPQNGHATLWAARLL